MVRLLQENSFYIRSKSKESNFQVISYNFLLVAHDLVAMVWIRHLSHTAIARHSQQVILSPAI